uniref:Acylphosphatase n=1 Tax=Desulfatirhabdium butyrativorans TaxID=340467 RepID=A0A7C4ML70_9BACT
MEQMRVRVRITGRVQGVYFRAETQNAAQQIGVTGWVRNLRDGSVEAVFEGEAHRVRDMVAWCWKGSPFSRVDDVEVIEEPYQNEFQDFRVLRSA